MKKNILLSVAISMIAATGFAQDMQKGKAEMRSAVSSFAKMKKIEAKDASISRGMKSIKKSVASGLYYTRPEGTIYNAMGSEGGYYTVTNLQVPAFYDLTLYNRSTNPTNTTWLMNGNDVTQYTDENGNLYVGEMGTYNGYGSKMPVLTNGSDSYQMGLLCKNPEYSGIFPDSIGDKAFFSYAELENSNRGAAFGVMDTGYLLGTGNAKLRDGNTYPSYGILQAYPKPAGPLYIEDFHALVYSSTQPVSSDAKLTLEIYNIVTEGDQKVMGDKLLAQMTATADDCLHLGGPYDTQYTKNGKCSIYTITFSNWGEDEFGTKTRIPVTINEEFCVLITGVNDPGVDVGFLGYQEVPEDHLNSNVEPLILNGSEISSFGYADDITLNLCFTGGFDYIEAQNDVKFTDGTVAHNANILRVSEDGKTVTNEALTAAFGESVDFVYFMSAYPWYDHENNENYYGDMPEWVSVTVEDETDAKTGRRNGYEYVTVSCEALPAGVTGREAVIYFEGKGYKSATPLIIVQGDAEPTGIGSIETVAPSTKSQLYNLNGQRVTKDVKGILIRDGKKFVNNK